ncbi:MAG: hypothetical protein QXT86_13105 [Archaeoglobaceae archaeon]
MVYIHHSFIDKIVRDNPDIIPFSKIIPANEKRDILRLMMEKNVREETFDRKAREILPYLEKVNPPIVKVYFPGTIHGMKKIKWVFEDDRIDEPNLLYDYIIGHKSICFDLENLVKSPYIYLVVRYRDGEGLYEDGYQIDISRNLCLMKPDFISTNFDKETGRSTGKSHRLIKFRKGWLKVYAVLYYSPPGERKVIEKEVLLLALEVEWKRYGKPSAELTRIYSGSWNDYRELKEELGKYDDKHLFGLVHYKVKVRDHSTIEGDLITNVKTMEMVKRPVEFGHQRIEIMKMDIKRFNFKGWEKLSDIGGEVRLEPFRHKIMSELIVRNKKSDKYWFQPSMFEVYRRDNGESVEYIVIPRTPLVRLTLLSTDHWDEGWGRVLIEIKEGEVMLFTHIRPMVYQIRNYNNGEVVEERVWSPFQNH